MSYKARLLVWGVALVSTLGSLYFSEIKNFSPCVLCWYQRVLMYPLVIIIGISLIAKESLAEKYVLSLSILGLLVSLYHYIVQNFLLPVEPCGIDSNCTAIYINWFGFVTIPFLSFIAFFMITVITLLYSGKIQR
ncbi:disulfide bond formation protein B [Bacillaceae bacterium SAS-127]|nr:disulfide bond formation protein B [Bacillaceae bacterium SAS-127]